MIFFIDFKFVTQKLELKIEIEIEIKNKGSKINEQESQELYLGYISC